MPQDAFDQLKNILLSKEQQQIDLLDAELQKLRKRLADKSELIDTLKPVITESIAQKINDSKDDMAQALAPVMGPAIKKQIRDAKEDVIDALYPVIGSTIRKSIAEALKKIALKINQKLDRAFSLKILSLRLKARFMGVKSETLILPHILPFTVHQVFYIHKETGLLLHQTDLPAHQVALDENLISGMLTAIRDFANSAFKSEENRELYEIQYDDLNIRLEMEQYTYLALVFSGVPPANFDKYLIELAKNLRAKYLKDIREFSGDVSAFDSANQITVPFLQKFQSGDEAGKAKRSNSFKSIFYFFGFMIFLMLITLGLIFIPGYLKDCDIQKQVNEIINSGGTSVENNLNFEVDEQEIFLSGTVTDWHHLSRLEKALSVIPYVKTVKSDVRSEYQNFNPLELRAELMANVPAITKKDLSDIKFILNNDVLVLSGNIDSPEKKHLLAAKAAAFSPFRIVRNDLEVNDTNRSGLARISEEKIFFDRGVSTLKEEQLKKLAIIAENIKQLTFSKCTVFGGADATGSVETNRRIAFERARRIMDFFISEGIPAEKLEIQTVIAQDLKSNQSNALVDNQRLVRFKFKR